jgi:hypothetical protein
MAQVFTDDSFAAGHAGLTDLQNIENNFTALKSSFSGASAPSDAVAFMLWGHTTNKILKVRNNDNDAWLGVLYGPATLKTWIYANAATDGWVIDATVTDRVLSLKGGSQAYNANGGTNAGTWTIAGGTAGNASADHTHSVSGTVETGNEIITGLGYGYEGSNGLKHYHSSSISITSGGQSVTHNHTITFDGTTRPAAAIGTLQYPNV